MSDYPKDLAVKTGSYTDNQGNTKNRYENIGKMMMGDNGPYLLLKKTFNPAGVETGPGKDMVVVSVFDQRDKSDAPPQQQRQPSPPPPADGSPDIPF